MEKEIMRNHQYNIDISKKENPQSLTEKKMRQSLRHLQTSWEEESANFGQELL